MTWTLGTAGAQASSRASLVRVLYARRMSASSRRPARGPASPGRLRAAGDEELRSAVDAVLATRPGTASRLTAIARLASLAENHLQHERASADRDAVRLAQNLWPAVVDAPTDEERAAAFELLVHCIGDATDGRLGDYKARPAETEMLEKAITRRAGPLWAAAFVMLRVAAVVHGRESLPDAEAVRVREKALRRRHERAGATPGTRTRNSSGSR